MILSYTCRSVCTHVRGHVVQELAVPSLSHRGNKWPAQGPFLSKTGKLFGFKKESKAFLRSKKKKKISYRAKKKTVSLTYAKCDHTIHGRSPQTPAARWATAWGHDGADKSKLDSWWAGHQSLSCCSKMAFIIFSCVCVCVKLYIWSLRTH